MNSKENKYDYIICGAGCAGLSLAYHLCNSPFLNKSILIIDKDDKSKNDRTWCFWEDQNEQNYYDDIVSHTWENVRISNHNVRFVRSAKPFKYKKINGLDFYEYVKTKISESDHVHWIKDEILELVGNGDEVQVEGRNDSYVGRLCFNSIPLTHYDQGEYYLKQHFLGWVVRFDQAVFSEELIDLMDFRMPQEDGVRFIYVLPYSDEEAMVEMTIFSKEVFKDRAEYESLLATYLEDHYGKKHFEILDEEYGVIPMTTHSYQKSTDSTIINIGNRSGRIKPSSGYAFKNIQDEVNEIVNGLKINVVSAGKNNKGRFLFYDKILFNVILNDRMRGADIFSLLFEKNEVTKVFQFLSEKTSIWQEAKIFSTLPTWPFFRAMVSEIFRRLFYK